jgi:hypothetical protein
MQEVFTTMAGVDKFCIEYRAGGGACGDIDVLSETM